MRLIEADTIIPENQRKRIAVDEIKIGDHLEKFLLAEDNRQTTFVMSCPFGGTHIYCYAPSESLGRDYWTIVTMGMSGTKMNVPSEIEDGHLYARAEVLCYLPKDWPMPKSLDGINVTEENWPFEMLRSLAQYVGATGNWLAESHGIGNILSDPPGQPFVLSTKLSSMILLEPVNEAEEFAWVEAQNERVNFLVVVPLTPGEAQWKREVGAALSIFFVVGSRAIGGETVLIDYVIDAHRACVVEDLRACERVAQYMAEAQAEDEEDEEEGEDDDKDDDEQGEEDDEMA